MVPFKKYIILKSDVDARKTKIMAAMKSYKQIFSNMCQSKFQNTMTALQIYKSQMVTNATDKRSFSKLQEIKYCYNFTMLYYQFNYIKLSINSFVLTNGIHSLVAKY